jgi:hypothetical protein
VLGDTAFAEAPFASLSGFTYYASASEAAAIAGINDAIYTAGGLIDETVSAADVASAGIAFVASIAEASSGTVTVSNTANFVATAAEVSTGADTPSTIGTFLATSIEAAAGADTFSAVGTYPGSIVEASSGVVTTDSAYLYSVNIAEAGAGAATVTTTMVAPVVVQEAANMADLLSGVANIRANVTGVQLTVNIGNSLVWVNVDDTQDPGWTPVPT